jgi:ribonuclease HI
MDDAAELIIHTDGAARGNPGPAAFAYTIERDGAEPILEAGRLGKKTNNQAEYEAVIEALTHAAEVAPYGRAVVHSDSELLVKQMNGDYRVKNGDLRGLYERAQALCSRLRGGVEFRHVRREENRLADQLANEALDGRREPTPRASHFRTTAPTPATTAPSPRDRALGRLRSAKAAWASGAAEPTPEKLLDELFGLLKRQTS